MIGGDHIDVQPKNEDNNSISKDSNLSNGLG